MDYINKKSTSNFYNNLPNGKDIYLYQEPLGTNYILSEYQKKIKVGEEINQELNKKFHELNNLDKENEFKTDKFLKYNHNDLPMKDKIFNSNKLLNKINNITKKKGNETNGIQNITKSEPNLGKSRNNINKKINQKNRNFTMEDEFGDISEIKKSDNSSEEQNINPEFNMDYLTDNNNKFLFNEKIEILDKINDFKNNIDSKDIPHQKKTEIKKIISEYPELIYNEMNKNFSKFQSLIKENNILRKEIKKLNIEIKEKNDIIEEFTELFKQSKIKFEKLMLKNKINIEELEHNNINKIEQLTAQIKNLENEKNILIKKNKNLINSLNKYQKFSKNNQNQNSNIIKNFNKFNESSVKNSLKKQNVISSRDSTSSNLLLNSRINRRMNNYSKDINSFFDNRETMNPNNNMKTKYDNYSFVIARNKAKNLSNNFIDREVLERNTISKIGVESNLRKEKAIFRDLSANIEKKLSRQVAKRIGNSVRNMNTINGRSYHC